MLKHEDIVDGQLIITDCQAGGGEETIGVIMDVQNALESGARNKGTSSFPKELSYSILFPETGKKFEEVCEGSHVTSEARIATEEETELFLLRAINRNDAKIIKLRERNRIINTKYMTLLQKDPIV